MSTTRRNILKGILGGVSALVFPKAVLIGAEKVGQSPTLPPALLPSVVLPQTVGEFPPWICSGEIGFTSTSGNDPMYGDDDDYYDRVRCLYCGGMNSWKDRTCSGCGAPVGGVR